MAVTRTIAQRAYNDQMSRFDTGQMAGKKTKRGINQSTASGRPFWILDPRAEDIRTSDIAQQLARICRFGGALRFDVEHYSVAQHCCLVSDHCPPALRFEGLMHDAHEAYTGDMIKPVKMQVGKDWHWIERKVELAVRQRYGLPGDINPLVKQQDYLAVSTEHRDLQNVTGLVDWGTPPEPWPERIIPWGVFRARDEFMRRFIALYPGDKP